jgi:hypothetical protein
MPEVSVRSTAVAEAVKVRAQRAQWSAPEGRPATCRTGSGVVAQMGHANSKVTPPLASGAA